MYQSIKVDMSVDLNKLNSMLDNTLEEETTESLNEWLEFKSRQPITPQPLFTLTPEEVEIVEIALIKQNSIFADMKQLAVLTSISSTEIEKLIDIHLNLLTRIKQWQDEILSRNNT